VREFQYRHGDSNKFWNIDLEGSSYTVQFGRIGTKGQTKTKDFPNPQAAQTAYDKIIAEKLGEGYVETAAAAPAPAASTENVLERALLDDPDDLAAHSAYADWLSQQGDPRGEFIQVQLALEEPGRDAKERKALQKRERALLKAHAAVWLGGLADFLIDQRGMSEISDPYQFQFARGWLDLLRVPELSVEFARALVRAPEARLLRHFVIEGQRFEEAGDDYEPGDDIPRDPYNPAVFALRGCPFLSNVRVFYLGEREPDEDFFNCHTSGETAAELVAGMPRLEELYLLAHDVDLERLFALDSLTRLRVLQIYHNDNYPLEILAANPSFKNLTHLLLYPHGRGRGRVAGITLAGVRTLVHSPHLRSLTHLRLRLSDMGDEGCREIARSGILKRLKLLDLKYGCIGDRGAFALAGCADLRNLELLDLSYNRLGEAVIAALERVGVTQVLAHSQYDPDGADAEDYLYQGDIE
jgi:uncharacterized protein (TIGR02996 family)